MTLKLHTDGWHTEFRRWLSATDWRLRQQCCLVGFSANAQDSNRLQDIQVQSLPGQRVELKLIMSGTAPEPLAFTIEDPARIALDSAGERR